QGEGGDDDGRALRGQHGTRPRARRLALVPHRPVAQQRQSLQESGPGGLDRPSAQEESAPRWLHDYNSFFRFK
ncbi:hypothetical protein, partial [Achromobacter ruhlandii]|uniref:hypothetical protein n=1 Tax=Achromobacter ruhlandii TaxID=72557 RepID=UPI001B8BAF51